MGCITVGTCCCWVCFCWRDPELLQLPLEHHTPNFIGIEATTAGATAAGLPVATGATVWTPHTEFQNFKGIKCAAVGAATDGTTFAAATTWGYCLNAAHRVSWESEPLLLGLIFMGHYCWGYLGLLGLLGLLLAHRTPHFLETGLALLGLPGATEAKAKP